MEDKKNSPFEVLFLLLLSLFYTLGNITNFIAIILIIYFLPQ